MDSNRFCASLFVLSLAAVAATAQTPVPDNSVLAHVDFTTAQNPRSRDAQ